MQSCAPRLPLSASNRLRASPHLAVCKTLAQAAFCGLVFRGAYTASLCLEWQAMRTRLFLAARRIGDARLPTRE